MSIPGYVLSIVSVANTFSPAKVIESHDDTVEPR